jgi:hypothetical protein
MAGGEQRPQDESQDAILCHRHPQEPAYAMCVSCARPVCRECARREGLKYYCPDCHPLLASYPHPLPPTPPPGGSEQLDQRQKRWRRAGWSIPEVLVALLGIFAVYNAAGLALISSTQDQPTRLFYSYVTYILLFCPLVALSAVLILRRHHLGLAELGIRWGEKLKTFGYGFTGGLVAFSGSFIANIVVVLVFHLFTGRNPGTPESQNLSILSGPVLALAVLVAVVFAPIFEEVFFRGLLYAALRRRLGVPLGVFVSAAVFGVLHFEPLSLISLIFVGAVLAYLYERTDSLFASMITHAFYNAIVTVIALLRR